MNTKKLLVVLFGTVLMLNMILFLYTPLIRADNTIPKEYSQEIDLSGEYVYNVTAFGESAEWINFSDDVEDTWESNAGGQIRINFTGFYPRDVNDISGDLFPDANMSWMDIEIWKNNAGSLQLNYTNMNISNHEAAMNLNLGYGGFQSGFLISNNTDNIKTLAQTAGQNIALTIEETKNFILFRFEETEVQSTKLVYDRVSGLLLNASTSTNSYQLEMFLTNYTLDIEKQFTYDVLDFGPPGWTLWYDLAWPSTFKDIFATNKGGRILINFTGYYQADPNLFSDPFAGAEKRAWLDVGVVYKGDSSDVETMRLLNVSNSEAANAFLISLPGFLSGFLIPNINNDSFDIEQAIVDAISFYAEKEFKYTESDLTIRMNFQVGGSYPQKTTLIYEKITGLLLFVETEGQNYYLKSAINGYTAPTTASTEEEEEEEEDEKDGNNTDGTQLEIPSYSLPIIFSIISVISLYAILHKKKEMRNSKL